MILGGSCCQRWQNHQPLSHSFSRSPNNPEDITQWQRAYSTMPLCRPQRKWGWNHSYVAAEQSMESLAACGHKMD